MRSLLLAKCAFLRVHVSRRGGAFTAHHRMSGVLAAGIFAHETGQHLLQILLSLADRGFSELYERCQGDIQSDYYQVGLTRVDKWSDDVLDDDVHFVCEQFSDTKGTFSDCFTQYVEDRFRGRRRVAGKPFLAFVRTFLEHLGRHPSLRSGEYFQTHDPVVMRSACMDCARLAMYSLASCEPAHDVELASEVGGRDYEVVVGPDDSVSQVGHSVVQRAPTTVQRAPTTVQRAPTVVERAPTVVERAPTVVERAPTVVERAPTVVERAPSVVSRHDEPALPPAPVSYVVEELAHEQEAMPRRDESHAASRPSSVRVGMHKPRSPRY